MRTIKSIITSLTIASMAMVTSCVKTDVDSFSESTLSHSLYVTANIVDNSSRVSMEATTDAESTKVHLAWEPSGETFDVIDANNVVVAQFSQTADTEDEDNKFQGTLTSYGETVKDNNAEYTIVYPSAAALNLSEQNGTLDGSKVRMCGTYSGALTDMQDVSFSSHKTAIIKLHFTKNGDLISNNQISKVVVQGLVNQIVFSDNVQSAGDITITTSAQNDIYLNVPATDITPITFKTTVGDITYRGTLTPKKDIETGRLYEAAVNFVVYTPDTVSEQPAGDGSPANPYIISTPQHLKWVVNNGADGDDNYYELNSDINIETTSENPWTYCNNLGAMFQGHFKGNNHTISGKIVADANSAYAGFIGCNVGAISYLKVDAQVIGSGTLNQLPGTPYYISATGSIVGLNYGGEISDCTSEGEVTSKDVGRQAGAIVGVGGIVGGSLGGNIYDSNSSATVIGANMDVCPSGKSAAGGIAGVVTAGTVYNCSNTGSVTAGVVAGEAGPDVDGGEGLVAGIVGFGARLSQYSNIVISYCNNSGAVSGVTQETGDRFYYAAGIVAMMDDIFLVTPEQPMDGASKIDHCINQGPIFSGDVTNQDKGSIRIGGIAAAIWLVDISDCTNNGTITAGRAPVTVHVAGIVGRTDSDNDPMYYFIQNVSRYANGIPPTIQNCKNNGTILGSESARYLYIGGIIGETTDGYDIIKGNINKGAINARGTAMMLDCHLGGIVGMNNSGMARIFDCINEGNLTAPMRVGQRAYIGGISGRNTGVAPEDYVTPTPEKVDKIYDCRNEGEIIIPAGQILEKEVYNAQQFVGGVVGYIDIYNDDDYDDDDYRYNPQVCSCCTDTNANNLTKGYALIGNNEPMTQKCDECTSDIHATI